MDTGVLVVGPVLRLYDGHLHSGDKTADIDYTLQLKLSDTRCWRR